MTRNSILYSINDVPVLQGTRVTQGHVSATQGDAVHISIVKFSVIFTRLTAVTYMGAHLGGIGDD
jgi:hypothetical protein